MKRSLMAGFGLVYLTGGCVVAQPLPPPAVPPVVAQPAQVTGDAATFYDAMAPYGDWFWQEPYGWVWSPRGMTVD